MYLLRYFLKLVHETLYKNKNKQKKPVLFVFFPFLLFKIPLNCAVKPVLGIFIL